MKKIAVILFTLIMAVSCQEKPELAPAPEPEAPQTGKLIITTDVNMNVYKYVSLVIGNKMVGKLTKTYTTPTVETPICTWKPGHAVVVLELPGSAYTVQAHAELGDLSLDWSKSVGVKNGECVRLHLSTK